MTSRQISQVVSAELVQPLFNKINALAKSQQHAHWYMRRLEEYLSVCSRRPVSEHTADEITGWFSDLGRKAALTDWQFRQRVEAVGILIRVAQAPAFKQVDWKFWLSGVKSLEINHSDQRARV